MNEILLIVAVLVILTISITAAYFIGACQGAVTVKQIERDLDTSNAVRHNLNCLVGDLKAEVAERGQVAVRVGNVNKKFKAENVRLDALLHVQNVKVLEAHQLLHDVNAKCRLLKADAAAWNQSKGLWCTDQPNIIRHHAKRELFFRLGYPEHRL